MNTTRLELIDSNSEVFKVKITDVKKLALLSDFFRGALNFGIERQINIPFPKEYIKQAVKYLGNPTVENYIATNVHLREFLGLNPSNRYEWLENSYKTISRFLQLTDRIFIWDTTPDLDEVIDNLMLTVAVYKLDTILYRNIDEYVVDKLKSKSQVEVREIKWLDVKFSKKSILFSLDAIWWKMGNDILHAGQYNSYFYRRAWNPARDYLHQGSRPRMLKTPVKNLYLRETPFIDLDVGQSVDYPKDTIDPVYKLVHTEGARMLGKKEDIVKFLTRVPQINSFGLYPPRFEVIDIDESFDLNTIMNPDAVIIFMVDKQIDGAVHVNAADISVILEGCAIVTNDRNAAIVFSPFSLDQKVPVTTPVIVVDHVHEYRHEVVYRSLNQVTYYRLSEL